MFEIKDKSLRIKLGGFELIHAEDFPILAVGYGENSYEMSHGNFNISKYYKEKIPLKKFRVLTSSNETCEILFLSDNGEQVKCEFTIESNSLKIRILEHSHGLNRFWLYIPTSENEEIYGCGEQFSYLNLRGKRVPLWVSEQGVGRNKRDIITHFANFKDDAGGDWYTTYFPQPTFVSNRSYYAIFETYAYSEFDFSHKNFHEIEIHEIPKSIEFGTADNLYETVLNLTKRIGLPNPLPDWVYDGVILGLQGGRDIVMQKIKNALDKGLKISGLWIQDWEGKRVTTFGKQLMWNWVYDANMYPNLPEMISELRNMGIRTLGYINTFLALEGSLYKEASEKGYLVRKPNGEEYHVVVTTFPAALVDFTNPEAREWIKNVIKTNMIGIGLSGWMADFGEYLPTDAVLYDGTPAELYHNRFPVDWAKINAEAVAEAGKSGEVVFFMRAGNLYSSKYSTLFWHGDQMVNWSKDDGLPSVIVAALSMTMSGIGLTHSDIGGYTTLAKNVPDIVVTKRTKELFMRWVEQATFTPVMRTHEGNWPDENWQFDSDEETLLHFAKMSRIHALLKPYIKNLVGRYSTTGNPIIMPLNLKYKVEDTEGMKYEYLFGEDLLVAPVIESGQSAKKVFLPDDEWVHLWSGKRYRGGWYEINAPIGYPPVFYRQNSEWGALFEKVGGAQ
ncbi:alpha-glucosidase [Fervidobacterium gondwanense]|uniref:alpha-glucosidase n=1 Tax=Fervidobacterium gondwanense TaxID=44754 RepID=UPI003C75A7CE